MKHENKQTMLDELVAMMVDNTIDEQMMKLCDMIWEQESVKILKDNDSFVDDTKHIRGPNTMLLLPAPKQRGYQGAAYLELQRVWNGEYTVGLYIDTIGKSPRCINTWSIKESNPTRIIKKFAEVKKYLAGLKSN